MKTLLVAALSLTLGLCAVSNAQATPITSDTLVCNGVTTVVPEVAGEQRAFLANFCPDPNNGGDKIVDLTEPDGSISDQLWLRTSGAFSFASDNNPSTLLINTAPDGTGDPTPVFIAETGALIDLSAIFRDPPGTILVQSDADAAAVPEPTTLLLVGSGLAVAARRRKPTIS